MGRYLLTMADLGSFGFRAKPSLERFLILLLVGLLLLPAATGDLVNLERFWRPGALLDALPI